MAMRVRDIETSPAITCEPGAHVSQVARMMREKRVGSVFVVDEIGVVVGVVTDRDLVERVIAPEREPSTRVEEVMSHDVVCAQEDDDVLRAADQMATRVCRRLPVLASDGRLAGVVSLDDLVLAFANPMEQLARAIGREILPAPMLLGLA
jgi:signal-transduction protein with cAMP-binding, CBS, and nucleotidyltransferase domain